MPKESLQAVEKLSGLAGYRRHSILQVIFCWETMKSKHRGYFMGSRKELITCVVWETVADLKRFQ